MPQHESNELRSYIITTAAKKCVLEIKLHYMNREKKSKESKLVFNQKCRRIVPWLLGVAVILIASSACCILVKSLTLGYIILAVMITDIAAVIIIMLRGLIIKHRLAALKLEMDTAQSGIEEYILILEQYEDFDIKNNSFYSDTKAEQHP